MFLGCRKAEKDNECQAYIVDKLDHDLSTM